MRVIVVEDQQLLADAIGKGLRKVAMAVDIAYDGADALEKLDLNAYDVVVLDRDLPTVSGDDVCRAVTASGNSARILMLTASDGLHDRVSGLNLGADDYLGKPFDMVELVARVRALGRRSGPATAPDLRRSGIHLDRNSLQVTRDGRPVPLTRKEFTVLEELMRAGGAAVSTETLLERAWDEHTDPFTNVVRVTVGNLRKKLGAPPVIATVHGFGYRIP